MSLTLVRRLPKDTSYSGANQYRALVACTCGAEYETGFYSYKKYSSCRRCAYDSRTVADRVSQTFLGRVQRAAVRRNIDFSLTLDEANEVLSRQGNRCVYTGRELETLPKADVNFSLDRVDSSMGYSIDNVQFVYKPINVMKHVLTDEDFVNNICMILRNREAPACPPAPTSHAKQYRGTDHISLEQFNGIKANAKRRGIDFQLSIQDVEDQYMAQGGLCDFTLQPVEFKVGASGTASIDRVDSSLGYAVDNICIVHKDINFMKSLMTEDEFFMLCEEIYLWAVVLGCPNNKKRND